MFQCWFVTVLILDGNRQPTLNSQLSLSHFAVCFWSIFLLHSGMTYINKENEARSWEMNYKWWFRGVGLGFFFDPGSKAVWF